MIDYKKWVLTPNMLHGVVGVHDQVQLPVRSFVRNFQLENEHKDYLGVLATSPESKSFLVQRDIPSTELLCAWDGHWGFIQGMLMGSGVPKGFSYSWHVFQHPDYKSFYNQRLIIINSGYLWDYLNGDKKNGRN